MNAAQLDHTAKVLAEMLTFKQPADAVLSAYFREHKKLGRQDRHEIAETAFAALRHYQKISAVLRRPHAQPRKAALAALVLGRSTNISQIKELIIDSLGLEDITPADIGSEDPLFGDEGLGLDSVDALELGLAVQKTFGFQLDGENDNLRENFANVKTLAEFVKSRQA